MSPAASPPPLRQPFFAGRSVPQPALRWPVSGGGGGGITHGSQVTSANVGLHVATTNTHAGALYDSGSAFAAHAISGAGTSGSPYLIDRRRYTDDVRVRDTTGIYAKFTNCKFEGNPGNPTPGGSTFFWNEDTGAFITIEDSTFTTAGGPSLSSTAGGCDLGFRSYVPFTLRRCDLSMANVCVSFEIEQGEAASLVEECYVHHTWSASGDHTDLVNGNFHSSHITARRCKLYGIRTGDTYVTNGFGIYDDPATSAGIIEDWTIESCYVDRCATMILSNTSTSRFLDPFVVTDNILTTDFTVTRSSCRTPSSQSGNRDESGTPITL